MALGNVHLTPQLVQAVRDAADIVSVASEHTRLRKAGHRWQGLCPLHKEKTPSFSVDPDRGLFYCFGCGKGGDAIKLHMLVTGDDFPAAIEALAMRWGIPLPTRDERRGGRPERDVEGALAAAAAFFTDRLRSSPLPLAYLENRRIPSELVERFGLGYAPDAWRTLIQALTPRVSMADLEAAGLVARSDRGGEPYDRFRNRLMFPIHNASGRLVGFGGRTLGDDKAKYINTAETERFHKGEILYGLHQAKRELRESGRAVLVEGYFDVVGSVAAGVETAIAGMGTALTPEQAKLLSRYAEEVVVAYDGDQAGEGAFRRALPLLLGEGLAVRRARFPEGHDPDSLRLAEGEEAVVAAIDGAPDAVVAEIERLAPPEAAREPQAQARAAKAVAELLRPIPDAILRNSYGRIGAERLRVSVELLARRAGSQDAPSRDNDQGIRMVGRSDGRHLGRGLEEQVIRHLLLGDAALPPPPELLPPEAFFDPECRNIYRAFCTLHAEGAGRSPDARAVLAVLGAEHGESGGVVDRVAQILLERNFLPEKPGFGESYANLADRWYKQREKQLAAEIHETKLRGDEPRLDQLLEEWASLTRKRHPRSRLRIRGQEVGSRDQGPPRSDDT